MWVTSLKNGGKGQNIGGWLGWHPRSSPCLKILNVITFAASLLPGKVTYAQVLGIRV